MPNAPKGISKPWLPKRETNKHNDRKRDENDKFYSTNQWKQLRDYFIKRNPICSWCDEEGKTKLADVVDHILPIKKGGSRTDENNLQSLCHRHHNQKSGWDQKRKKEWNIKPTIK